MNPVSSIRIRHDSYLYEFYLRGGEVLRIIRYKVNHSVDGETVTFLDLEDAIIDEFIAQVKAEEKDDEKEEKIKSKHPDYNI